MNPVEAEWGWVEASRIAVMEMAAAAGLGLVEPAERDPTRTTTYGVGELISAALDAKARRIIVGLGGSATVDGGTGMAEALGVRFEGCGHPMTGDRLANVGGVDLTGIDTRLQGTEVIAATDVHNPLLGPRGAARVFGPQKGATTIQVELLERGLVHLTSFLPQVSPEMIGAGAAGGLGWGLAAFCGAGLRSGIELCLETVGFDALLNGADLVLTGEGSFDLQSLEGKAPLGVARRASAAGIPVVVLAGKKDVSKEACRRLGISACHSICQEFDVTEEEAIGDAATFLEELTARTAGKWLKGIPDPGWQ
jgi:glycerate kinase